MKRTTVGLKISNPTRGRRRIRTGRGTATEQRRGVRINQGCEVIYGLGEGTQNSQILDKRSKAPGAKGWCKADWWKVFNERDEEGPEEEKGF
ncbi:hypothetical protein Nepgr_007876 [Nepenthes gracilis]|uniref:Uncharacterized protein n=1 Tax=Nepenthes gracilis TaxID=150966 RepID=A0AAD3S8M1_NEPGR|nr:hypothetical protein Nepgr_007876 [Nepenthes gracilis]